MIKIELKYNIVQDDDGATIKHILRDKLNISSRLLNKLKMNEKILVNNIPVFSNYIVHYKDEIIVKIDFEETDYIVAEEMNLDIIYEDDYFLAINKEAGIVVHPCANHLSGTLANGVKYYLNNNKKIRAINRIDRDTSGIVLFAKNEYIQEIMIKNVKIEKEYIAIANGILDKKSGTINKPIARKPCSIMERCVSEEGQKAITHYEVIKELKSNLSVIKLKLETGRTHQIRVHLAYLGAPILGDSLYGDKSELITRQALHSYMIRFFHPISNENLVIFAALPKDMKNIIGD